MHRDLDSSRRWMREGTEVILAGVADLGDAELAEDTALPGWTRRHVVAHVAANAAALGNLVHWAATGVRTPMYASPEERARGIDRGIRLPPGELRAWLQESAQGLEDAVAALAPVQWSRPVVTAQGRTVPATEIPWLRAREVWVHAVDLGRGVSFADLPEDFLLALEADVITRRGKVPDVTGPLAERVAWLTGRPHALNHAPALDPWL